MVFNGIPVKSFWNQAPSHGQRAQMQSRMHPHCQHWRSDWTYTCPSWEYVSLKHMHVPLRKLHVFCPHSQRKECKLLTSLAHIIAHSKQPLHHALIACLVFHSSVCLHSPNGFWAVSVPRAIIKTATKPWRNHDETTAKPLEFYRTIDETGGYYKIII